jgi:hypothetical protein
VIHEEKALVNLHEDDERKRQTDRHREALRHWTETDRLEHFRRLIIRGRKKRKGKSRGIWKNFETCSIKKKKKKKV